jgi:hypothetical protein
MVHQEEIRRVGRLALDPEPVAVEHDLSLSVRRQGRNEVGKTLGGVEG